jgi:HK97 family phage major capsid protein
MKMKRIQELREKRAAVWEQAKRFLDEHRQENGLISPEDTAVYEKMEDEVVSLGKEIERLERQEMIDRELSAPINKPLTTRPDKMGEEKTGRAATVKLTLKLFGGDIIIKPRGLCNISF